MGHKLNERKELFKKKIQENVAVNDELVCGFCDELIRVANEMQDWQSVALGYVWRADYFFYVAFDLKALAKELAYVQQYIDEKNPSELLEKYYTLKRLYYEGSFDSQSAFRYCLKALDVAEKMKNQFRVSVNYASMATYFVDYGYYEEALAHLNKMRALPETKPRTIRLLLSNLVETYLKLGRPDMARQVIEELRELPIEEKDLKIYVDYSYLRYYAELMNEEKSLYYLQSMFEDEMLNFPNRTYVIEFMFGGLDAMIRIKHQEKAKELLTLLQGFIKKDELAPLLLLCRHEIEYLQKFGTQEERIPFYQKYYTVYQTVQSQIDGMKVDGLRAKVELNDLYMKNKQSEIKLKELYELANLDGMTKVYNRRYLNIKQDEILNEKEYHTIGFVIFDIDYFKEYNDYYGHLAGDNLLIQLAECLRDQADEQTAVFRYGGDEFVCLSWGVENKDVEEYVQRIINAWTEKNLEHLGSRCAQQVTLSAGFGCRPVTNKVNMIALFNAVDKALYAAKNSGRNCAKPTFAVGIWKGEV